MATPNVDNIEDFTDDPQEAHDILGTGTQVFDTPESIAFFQLAAMKGRLKLEIKGLKFRGRSTYSIAKQKYGLKGNRASVYAQLEAMVEDAIAKKQQERQV